MRDTVAKPPAVNREPGSGADEIGFRHTLRHHENGSVSRPHAEVCQPRRDLCEVFRSVDHKFHLPRRGTHQGREHVIAAADYRVAVCPARHGVGRRTR